MGPLFDPGWTVAILEKLVLFHVLEESWETAETETHEKNSNILYTCAK